MPEPIGSSRPDLTPLPAAATDPTIASPDFPPSASPVGEQTRIGRYRVLEPLGHGGMGFVFKAWHEGLERLLALKVIQLTAQTPAALVERFLLEARAVARIGKHPNIVQVHDAGHEGPYYYIGMDLVEGEPLHRHLRGKPLDPREAARIARGVARGLQVAHEAGIVHRDLKPSNVLLSRDGTPLVGDFGLARDTHEVRQMSQEGEVLGTLFYMAPEQASGERARIGPATDVYGLGATLYEMLAGRPPFSGANQFEVWTAIVGEAPRPPRSLEPSVPQDIETICLKALAKSPPDRYADAREMGEDLDRFLAGEPIQGRAPSAVTRLVGKVARRKAVVLPFFAAVFLAAGGLAWLADHRARRASEIADSLAEGRRERAAGHAARARDAFQHLLAFDAGSSEAREGIAWADGEMKRAEAAAAEARRHAEELEAEAKETLRKANLAQAVLARWALLLPTLATMERDFFDSTLPKGDRRKRADASWPAVESFMRATPDDATSRATMLALAGWARCLAERQAEGLDWMAQARAADPDLPYADVMEALVHLSRYLEEDQLPAVFSGAFGMEIGRAFPEPPELREIRSRIESLLDAASKRRVWGAVGTDFHGVVEAVRAMQAGKYVEAEKGFGDVLGAAALSGFRADFLLARGKARYLLGRYEGALSDLDRVVEARPGQGEVYYFRGLVRAAVGDRAMREGKDPGDAYLLAITELDASLARIPHFYFAALAKGTALLAEAHARASGGKDGKKDLDRAIDAFDEVLRDNPGDPMTLVNRAIAHENRAELAANPLEELDRAIEDLEAVLARQPDEPNALDTMQDVLLHKGQVEMDAGQDPRKSLHHVVELCDAALGRKPDAPEALMNRGLARACEADWLVMHGQDPHTCWKAAQDDFTKAIEKEPRLWNARANLGMLFAQEGKYDEAIKVYEEALKLRPGEPQLQEGLSHAQQMARAAKGPRPAWWKEINDATRDSRALKYSVSRAEYEAAFAKVTEADEKDPHWQPILADAHYNLACSYALRAIGKEEPTDAAKAIGAAEAALWKDKAFDHLRRARAQGWDHLDHLKEDPDLVPLHDDPRWSDLIKAP